jgi:hypothetical protein
MNKITSALIMCSLFASLAAAQFVAAGDSVYTTPARPTTKDSITYNFLDSDACCCAEFYQPSVSVSGSNVYLNFSLNTTPCQACRCIGTGEWYAFKGGPLSAGTHTIYRAQSFYCPPGTACPAIVLQPIRIGEVVVTGSTTIQPMTQEAGTVTGLALSNEKGTILVHYALAHPGRLRVTACDARGALANEICNEQAFAGPHRFSWTAAAAGVYVLSVEVNGVAAATRKVIVSR